MTNQSTKTIKKAKKESQFLRVLSELFLQLTLDDASLQKLIISRVELSDDKSICFIYFFTQQGKSIFDELLPKLLLYKPSLRKSLSQLIPARYTPQLVFKYDKQYEKQQRVNALIEKLKTEGQL